MSRLWTGKSNFAIHQINACADEDRIGYDMTLDRKHGSLHGAD